MTAPYRPAPAQHGSKPMTREYKRAAATMAATMHRDAPRLTDEERDELIRKAGGR